MNEEFPDFSDKKVRKRIGIEYHAGLIGYTSLDVNHKPEIKIAYFLKGKDASPRVLLELLDSCLSGSDDFEGVR